MTRRRLLVRSRALLAAPLLLSAAAGCLPCCGDTQTGDAAAPLQAQVLVRDDDGYRPLESGADVPLVQGGQGFMMLVVGVRAQNVDVCGVQFDARIVDARTGELLDQTMTERNLWRENDTHASTQDDDASAGAWLLPCSGGFTRRRLNLPVRIELTITDRQGKAASATAEGRLTCPEDACSEWLPCEDAGIDGGTEGGTDAGTDGGTDAGVDGGM